MKEKGKGNHFFVWAVLVLKVDKSNGLLFQKPDDSKVEIVSKDTALWCMTNNCEKKSLLMFQKMPQALCSSTLCCRQPLASNMNFPIYNTRPDDGLTNGRTSVIKNINNAGCKTVGVILV